MTTAKEIQLSFSWEGLTLAGSLHLPAGPRPHPGVVMAQGSGPTDRDSGGYFEPIRRTFLEHGIATYAFDKPGCGKSSGDWRSYGLSARADQIVAAMDLLRNHAAVDPGRLGIWGHSQGGWLVQMLAGRPIDLTFAIASSAPSIGVAEQVRYDCAQSMRSQGSSKASVARALRLTETLFEAAERGEDFESISRDILEPARNEAWYVNYPAPEDAADWGHVQHLIGERFEPLNALARVQCPFLAVYGGLDALLPPWQGAQESGLALADAPTNDSTVVVFPSGDHRLQQRNSHDFVEGYLDLLGDWSRRRTEPNPGH